MAGRTGGEVVWGKRQCFISPLEVKIRPLLEQWVPISQLANKVR